ncbi:C25 family cysteine peptidase [Ferruginibacter sp. SUN106]|uniref:putative type IX secretion system sortase PorU2 n=1 Tax=Ferruginibacter sp. SUN106 TaxID=2978348 RepID=UPI003D36BC45
MKKSLLTVVLLLIIATGYGQLNNNWIDYNKTYYKFKITRDTLCRLYQPALAAIGLGSTPAQNFQLWRNGQQVRLYTSVTTGTLGATDFIEFWGEMNDGKPDKFLYRDTSSQPDDKYSLFSDTATYFLTVNTTGANLRYVQTANPVAGNVLPADAYFMRRVQTHFKDQINRGMAADFGEYVYSAAFDLGEGWSTGDIAPASVFTNTINGLNKYTAGPANSVTFTLSAFGNALYTRDLGAKINGTNVWAVPNPIPNFSYHKDTVRNLPLSILSSPSSLQVDIQALNSSNASVDRIVASCFSVTYPATFDFNNEKNFYFELAPSATGNYVVINNFNNNGVQPILYDINNGRRYLGDISTAGQVKFVLPASSDAVRRFNLISQDATNVYTIAALTTKTFLNITATANQGDYIIISNPVLYNNGSGTNYVDQYRQYRSSATGGGYTAKVYDINELTDQFGFGISKHPAAIRDFIRYANQQFGVKPKFVFLIGRAVAYNEYKVNQADPAADKLNLVPTFGWPASDVLLVSEPGTVLPIVPVGRIGAVTGNEVGNYLEKMKQYEQAQMSTIQTIAEKAWMKNIIHIAGGASDAESASFVSDFSAYQRVAEDTLFGARVETFIKSGSGPVQQASSAFIEQLFKEGLSFIGYFGHSSASTLAFNLSSPEIYENQGKYPFINVSGCSAGNYFNFDPTRLAGNTSLSEKYTFASQKGSIGFFADTHLGVEPYLDHYNNYFYKEFCINNYGGTVGDQMKKTVQNVLNNPPPIDLSPGYFNTRLHLEELSLQGDPALRINWHSKPDYIVEEQLIKISPSVITVADPSFNLNVKMLNIGTAINDTMRVTVKRKLPNDTIQVLFNQRIPATRYSDSVVLPAVHINPLTDKGLNKIIVTLDVDNKVSELSESNNTAEKEFFIYEDELRPVYPYNFSIVNQQNITFTASTANPLVLQRQYAMEVDTTELFNSAFKKTYTASGNGGVIEFKPSNLTFTDSTVYYWRTSMVPIGSAAPIWNTYSFTYLASGTAGFNQSHYYQYLKNDYNNIDYLTSRIFDFKTTAKTIAFNAGIYPYYAGADINVQLDNNIIEKYGCKYGSLQFYVFDSKTLEPWQNYPVNPGSGRFGSWSPACDVSHEGATRRFFEFPYTDPAYRKKAMDFIDSIPDGMYVGINNLGWTPNTTFVADWQADPAPNLYQKLKSQGLNKIDSFYRNIPFVLFFQKGPTGFVPVQDMGATADAFIAESILLNAKAIAGTIASPVLGPAKAWGQFHYRGKNIETISTDSINFQIIGVTPTGAEATIFTLDSTKHDFDISSVSATQYPYLKLKMFTKDSANATPYQLRYWRVNYTPVPEGVIAPNILFSMKDTVEQGEVIDFKVAFKNISPAAFDSAMKFKFTITDNNNLPHQINLAKGKILIAGDTLSVQYKIETKDYPGNNTLFIDVNPNNDQPEQSHFNNVLFKDFYVRPDNYNPLLDVTFDGVHILNSDIVAAKPHIYIKLKDESRFMAITDTASLKVQVRYPDNTLHNYNFGDTMRFNPANLASGENSASIDFTPYFPIDGDYELIVSGKDAVGNKAGALEYHVMFSVINKPMISNLLNYPNPFTTSTAFVFTITGSELPQNIRIQILTITGKVVREITKDELGPIHIGRNITDFKWDGTDTYGQKLANGVYLYRVLTNLNGQSLEKYKGKDDRTDQYFNKGYGKMVIIR